MPHAAQDAPRDATNRAATISLHRLSQADPSLLESNVNRKLWLQTALTLTLACAAVGSSAQSPVMPEKVKLASVASLVGGGTAASGSAIAFDSVPLAGAPQQLTATFAMGSGFGQLVPSASLHYGHDYALGPVSCSGQSCSVTVSFTPTLPGSRPDALFLSSGAERIATILLSGTGQAPFALLQPVTPASVSGASAGTAVVDENGTLYLLNAGQGSVTSIDSTGKQTLLPISGLSAPRGLAIDGAGVLYVLNGGTAASLLTFDTVQGMQGSKALPVPANMIDSITLGSAGELYAISSTANALYTFGTDGVLSTTPLKGGTGAAEVTSAVALGGGNGLVLGGGALQTVTHAGAQSAVAVTSGQTGSSFGVVGTDAAGTLYANSSSSLLELAAPSFGTTVGTLPSALAIGTDGSLLTAAGQGFNRLDRTQAQLYFGAASSSDPQLALLYNAGNAPLTISDIAISGAGFAIASTPGTTCVGGAVLASGTACEIGVTLSETAKANAPNGSLTITSNSLNEPTAQNTVTLVPHTTGSQVTLSASTLTFPSTTVKIASAPLTVTVTNTGTVALNFTSIALTGAGSGSYSLTQNCYTSSSAMSLAAGASCTVSVIFTPLVTGTIAASVSIVDDANVSSPNTVSQPVALTGVGVAAPAPVLYFSGTDINGTTVSPTSGTTPPIMTFGSTSVDAFEVIAGTGTPATGAITISNTGNAVMNLSSISLALAGSSTVLPYTQTNNCGATLAASASCVVNIQFLPPLGGAVTYTASLIVVDNAVGTPHIFSLTGTPTADDFTVYGSAPNITISSAGGTGSFIVTATPDPGPFSTPIDFTLFGLPKGAVYSFSPSSILAVTSPSNTTLTITLPAYNNVVLSSLDGPAKLRLAYGPVSACLMVGLCLAVRRRRMPRLTRVLQILMLGALGSAATSVTACGGVPISSGVAPGTYPLSIQAQSANGAPLTYSGTAGYYPAGVPTHFVTVNLVVQ